MSVPNPAPDPAPPPQLTPHSQRDQVPAGALVLDPECTLCDRHGEPFRTNWPQGYAGWALAAIKTFAAYPGVAEIAGGELAAIPEKLLTQRPLCCQLEDEHLLDCYLEARKLDRTGKTFPARLCTLCSRLRPAARCRAVAQGCKLVRRWFCLRCIVYRVQPMGVPDGQEPAS